MAVVKDAMRIKGMPQKTIAEDGTRIQLVYHVYAGYNTRSPNEEFERPNKALRVRFWIEN